MKRITVCVLATMFVLLGTAQISRADNLAFYVSTDNGASWTQLVSCASSSCATTNSSFGGIDIFILGASANFPGNDNYATTSTTDFSIHNTNSTTTNFLLAETALTYTQPSFGPLYLSAQQTVYGSFGSGSSMTTTGVFSNSPTIAPFSGCSVSTDQISSTGTVNNAIATNSDLVQCASSGPFGLETLISFSIAGGATLNAGTTVTSAVPEPASMLLFGTGLMGLAGVIRRKLRK